MTDNKNTKKDAAMERILLAAEKEFVGKGFEATTMRSIAQLAGCDHALVHHYFKDKQELFNRIFDSKLQELSMSSMLLLDDEGSSFAESLRKAATKYFKVLEKDPNLAYFLVSELHRDRSVIDKIGPQAQPMFEERMRVVQRKIDAAAERKEIVWIDAKVLIEDLILLNMSAFAVRPMLDILNSSSSTTDQWLDEIINLLMNRIGVNNNE